MSQKKSQKLNILFISTEIPYPVDHGHHIRTYNVLKYLSNDSNVYFLAFAKTTQELQNLPKIEKYCRTVDVFQIPFFRSRWYMTKALFLNLFSPLPFVVQKYSTKEAKERIKQLLVKYKIDLVHLDLLPLGIYYQEVKKLPNILVNHNVESVRLLRWSKVEKNVFIKIYLLIQYLKLRKFEMQICPKFDKCVTVSEVDKETLKRLCRAANFVTIPNGVDVQYFKPNGIHPIPNSLVWVGGMNSPYNQDAVNYFLDKIFPLIKSKVKNVTVTFVGAFPAEKLVIKSLSDPHIKYTGYVEDIRPYVDKASVFVAPIRSGSGTKIKILNALSQGKAVVTTSVGAEGIEVTPYAEIVIADAPSEFAEKTVYLLRNPEIAKKMGEKAQKTIRKQYSWQLINQKMKEVYTETVKMKLN